jgi:uncharacterized protein (TIGR02996 family)
MHDDEDFLRKLLENPADDTVRLVYADWLDERGDDQNKRKSQFLRLTVRLLEPDGPGNSHEERRREMQPLAAKLPTDWLAVVSRLKVESCGALRAASELWDRYRRQFDFVCDKRWDEMTPTSDPAVRLCDACQQNVHYCDTITEARKQAERGHCVAVDLGIIRREDDLSPPMMLLGRPSPQLTKQERKRLELDEVSREREERKRQERKRQKKTE